jgi:phosphopantetheinyl transferase (holo-ACP synthase)
MIGNDLVDLTKAALESNWRRPGYLHKIFNPEEQAQIQRSDQPDQLVWLLWSMKESAYKIHSRQSGIRSFNPSYIACSILESTTLASRGIVRIAEQVYYSETSVNSEYVHSIAALTIEQLSCVRTKIYMDVPGSFDYRATKPACISHHGRYLALVY